MAITYARIRPDRLDHRTIEQIGAVHELAFAASIVRKEYPGAEVAAALSAEAMEPGFVLHVARDETGTPVGFAYGYEDFLTRPTEGWSKRLADALGSNGYEWLEGQFGFAWFGVLPRAQGRGIGSALHDRLIADVRCDSAWLVCPAHETGLRAFYERRGWRVLALDDLGTGTERSVMGFDLVEGQPRPRRATQMCSAGHRAAQFFGT